VFVAVGLEAGLRSTRASLAQVRRLFLPGLPRTFATSVEAGR
jgi:hypothetical protein